MPEAQSIPYQPSAKKQCRPQATKIDRPARRLAFGAVRRVSTQLQRKAISSLKRAITAFNSTDDDGRQTVVLLHLQHAAEMMLKAGLTNQTVAVFDKNPADPSALTGASTSPPSI
ncbi:MAG TPA: hypothetical protein VF081_14495 [Solirubrobacterales bacterium]